MPKGKLVLQKNSKFLSVGGSQTPMPLAAGGFASRPPTASGGQWPRAANSLGRPTASGGQRPRAVRDADPSSKDV